MCCTAADGLVPQVTCPTAFSQAGNQIVRDETKQKCPIVRNPIYIIYHVDKYML